MDIDIREQILKRKNNVVFRVLDSIEKLDLYPEDYSAIRNMIRYAFVVYTNELFDMMGLKKVELWRK